MKFLSDLNLFSNYNTNIFLYYVSFLKINKLNLNLNFFGMTLKNMEKFSIEIIKKNLKKAIFKIIYFLFEFFFIFLNFFFQNKDSKE